MDVEARKAAVAEPVEGLMGRRLVAEERDRLFRAAPRVAGEELGQAGPLDLVDHQQDRIGSGPRVDLLDAHR